MADVDLERLVVSLEASITKYERAMAKASGTAQNTARKIERRFDTMNSTVARQLTRVGGAFLGFAAVREATKLIDAATRIENSLKVAGLAGDELTRVYDRLFESAQRNAAPLETLVQLYSRASTVQKELNVSTEDLLRFTDNVSVALRVAGTDAQSASGALLQLSQALGSGVVRAEEFNSILEGALPIAQAAAAGLTEAGGSVAKLRQLVIGGKVSSEAFFRAFEAGSVTLAEKVSSSESTASQSFVRLQNVLIDTAGKLDDVLGVSNATTGAIDALAAAFEGLGDTQGPMLTGLQATTREMNALTQATEDFWRNPSARNAIRMLFGDNLADQVTPGETPNRAAKSDRAPLEITVPGRAAPKTVSLSDFAAPSASGAGGASKADVFARELAQQREQTRELELQLTLIGRTQFERDRATAALELENAARRAGVTITAAQRVEIDGLANSYAVAAERVREAEDRFAAMNELQREFGQLAIDGISGLIDGTKSLNDVLGETLKRLAEMVAQAAFLGDGPLAGFLGTKSGNGGVGGIAGFIGKLFGFAGGGYTGGGGKYQPAGVVHRGEYVFDQAATKRIGVGNLEAMRRGVLPGYAGGGLVSGPPSGGGASAGIYVSVTQDNRGASPEAVARLEANQPRLIQAAVQQAMNAQREGVRRYGVKALGSPQ